MQITALLVVVLRKSMGCSPWGMIWVRSPSPRESTVSQGGQGPGMLRGGKTGMGTAEVREESGCREWGLRENVGAACYQRPCAICLHHQVEEPTTA